MGPIRVLQTDLHILNMRTRMPFKYGIATLTALPHLLVRVELECGQKRGVGIASDGLPPKWFTKDPDSAFADELADMFAVINSAATIAQECAPAQSVFQCWQRV